MRMGQTVKPHLPLAYAPLQRLGRLALSTFMPPGVDPSVFVSPSDLDRAAFRPVSAAVEGLSQEQRTQLWEPLQVGCCWGSLPCLPLDTDPWASYANAAFCVHVHVLRTDPLIQSTCKHKGHKSWRVCTTLVHRL